MVPKMGSLGRFDHYGYHPVSFLEVPWKSLTVKHCWRFHSWCLYSKANYKWKLYKMTKYALKKKLVCVLWSLSCVQLFRPRELTRLLCLWNFPGKNTTVGCHFLLQRAFLTQGLKLCLLHLLHWQEDFFFFFFCYHCDTWETNRSV